MKSGVPYDVAMSLPVADATAYRVIMGELEGGSFNWQAMAWEEPKGRR